MKKLLLICAIIGMTACKKSSSTSLPDTRSGDVVTIAGNGIVGSTGDGGLAISAEVGHPTGLAADTMGNLYIVDLYSQKVRKINTLGYITTIAGANNSRHSSGDSGLATDASFADLLTITVDKGSNIYVTDSQFIRKIDAAGIITTVAGNVNPIAYFLNGLAATSVGLGLPDNVTTDNSGNLYIAEGGSSEIFRVNNMGNITIYAGGLQGYSGDGGAATSAALFSPRGIAIDANNNLYIADCFNNAIRKVDATGIITTIAGNGSQGYKGDGGLATSALLNNPNDVALDGNGNIYISDCGNNRVRKINSVGIISTVAGNGISGYRGDNGNAISAEFNNIAAIAVDVTGNLYIADLGNNRIRKVNK